MNELDVSVHDLDEVYLAGAFGNYLRPINAIKIKMIPDIDPKKIKSIGNAAGTGAKALLRSRAARSQANEIVKKIEYFNLATHPKFQDLFVKNMEF